MCVRTGLPTYRSVVDYYIFGQKYLESPVDCDFVCTGARQNGPEKLGAKGTHKLFAIRPEARLEKILMKHVPFPIAPDFRPKTSENHSAHDRKVFRTPFLEFYHVSSFYGATRTRETDSSFASGRQARTHF